MTTKNSSWPGLLLGRPSIPQLPREPSGRWANRQLNNELPRANLEVPKSNLTNHTQIGSAISSDGESHLITIAPTGAGKGRDCIVPNLLSYEGSMVVLDPKGENYDVTHKFRKNELGQEIILLDPFGTCSSSDKSVSTFNPLDVFRVMEEDSVAPLEFGSLIADFLMAGVSSLREPFWDDMALTMIGSATSSLLQSSNRVSLLDIRKEIFSRDFSARAKHKLNDRRSPIDDGTLQDLSMLLGVAGGADATFEGIRSTAAKHLAPFGTPNVAKAVLETSFDLGVMTDSSTPFTLYVVMSPTRLQVYRGLLRTWIGSLLFLIMNSSVRKRLLFVIDEAAQLGRFTPLITAMTLMRGYGLRTWTFWQDISQIDNLYGGLTDTLLNNCGVVQIFGSRSYHSAHQIANRVSCQASDVANLNQGKQLLFFADEGAVNARRVSYLTEPSLRVNASPNPQHIFLQ